MDRNDDIQILRTVAVSMTILAHLATLNPKWNAVLGFFWLGAGVDLFFAISGFLICGSLLKQEQTRAALSAFYVRRIFRLWPAAYLCAFLTCLLAYEFRALGPVNEVARTAAAAVLQVTNIYLYACTNAATCHHDALRHYWSLALEEQFYLVLPLVLMLTRSRALIGVFIALGLVQAIAPRAWPSLGFFTRSDALLYGCAVALFWHHFDASARALLRDSTVARAAAYGLILALVGVSYPGWDYHFGAVAIVAGLIVLTVSANRDLLLPPGRAKAVALWLGERSYALYLVHFPVICIARDVGRMSGTPMPAMAFIAIGTMVLAAHLCFTYVEETSRAFGKRLAGKVVPLLPDGAHGAAVNAA